MLQFAMLAGVMMPVGDQVQPIGEPSAWISAADYPAKMIAADVEGTASVKLTVSAAGAPTDCTVRTSSGSEELDVLTCSLLMQRARFKPATGADGRATEAFFSTRIRWQIPREKLTTMGVRVTFDVGAGGQLANCRSEKYELQAETINCDPQMVDVMARHFLSKPLTAYQTVSVTIAVEADSSNITILRHAGEEERVIVTEALATISPDGKIAQCVSRVTADFQGRSLNMCGDGGPLERGATLVAPDEEGRTRQVVVRFEINGVVR